MRIYGNSRAFNLVELLATICIIAVLVLSVLVYVPQLVDWARQTSDRQTLTVLNDALSRYKTEGGSVSGLNPMTPASQVLTAMKTGVTWGGIGHQFLQGGITYKGRSLSVTGSGAQYRFTRYNYYTAEPGVTELNSSGGGLVGWWKFDEGSGSAVTDSSGGNTGALYNSPAWVAGHSGAALNFNGDNIDANNQYVDLGQGGSLAHVNEASYTLAAWVYINSMPSGSGSSNDAYYGIVIRTGYHFGLSYAAGGAFYMIEQLSSGYSISASAGVPIQSWHYIVGVVDLPSRVVKLYVDGNLKSTSAPWANGLTPYPTSLSWKIGIAAPGTSTWRWAADAKIDDVRVYNRALTAAEVAALYSH